MGEPIDQETADAAFKQIKEWEDFRPTIYSDPGGGQPALGYGYTLIVKRETEQPPWAIKKNVKADLEAIGIEWKDDYADKLQDIVKALNAGDKAAAGRLNAQLGIGPITEDDAEKLFHFTLPEHVGKVQRWLGEKMYDKLRPERRAALIDFAYYAPGHLRAISKELKAAITADDIDRAAELLANIGTGNETREEANVRYFKDPDASWHLVEQGDTLGAIADELGVTVDELMGLNHHLTDPDEINAGDVLRVPGNGAPQGQQPAAPAPSSGHQPATPPPGQRSGLEGGEGKAAARKEDLAASPEGRRFLAALEPKAGEEVGEVLLKPVDQWTEREMKTLMADPNYWRAAGPRGRFLQDKARAWHDHFFGTGPAPEDETGRMLPARPSRPIPTAPAAARAADGSDLAGSVLGIGKRVLTAAAEASLSEAIRGLQGGLNGLQTDDLNGLAGVARSGAVGMDGPALAVDGIFGPRTRRRLRGALAALGRAPVEKSFARSFARFRPAGSSARPGSRV